MFEGIQNKLRAKVAEVASRAISPALTVEQIRIFMQLREIADTKAVSRILGPLGTIPPAINLLNRDDIRAVLSHPQFERCFTVGRQALEEHKKLEAEVARKDREARELAERNKEYFSFWHYDGEVYGGSKYETRDGDMIRPVTEFFLRRPNGDEHEKLVGYDLPIANGQRIIVIYGCRDTGNRRGHMLQFINVNMRKTIDLSDRIKSITSYAPYNAERFQFEIQRYRQRL